MGVWLANHDLTHCRAAGDLFEHSSLSYNVVCYIDEINAAEIILPTVDYLEMNVVDTQRCHKFGRHRHATTINIQADIMEHRKIVAQPQER